jgi:hypothetical protein
MQVQQKYGSTVSQARPKWWFGYFFALAAFSRGKDR